ncbi:hypothetical protein M2163_001514 [Streptomyces sp. SAI-135]|uniref:DUF4232 domain-containing protein n=1 Tax=unclassified Streptomyces TaxID=2593676 RepID=UPI002476A2A9|nr:MULTISPECIES: DUF4232 domain-containing protein [unclassified Streptomyces]MDH6521496.1 hypothetical protein [Streptomyces sp. SAI-090]MDH6614406.1 hypothetical protein [Streptomyces sp. SAI-135]
MPTASRTAPAVLAAALLLTACGTQSASSGSDEDGGGPVKAEALCPSDFSRYGSPPSSEPSVRPSGTRTALPLPSAGGDGTAGNGAEITALYAWGPQSGCTGVGYSADFEITNQQTHTATYTLTFGFLSASGGAVDNVEHTVEAIAPGRAVKGTVVMGEGVEHAPEVTGVKVIKVRSVPEAEESSASGACPESGMRLYADEGNAAMGLRAVGLHLVNCGARPIRLNGYPKLAIQDEDHHPVDGVRILQGTDQISTGLGGDSGPQLVVLRPGEAAAATLAWRNTTQAGAPVNAPYVRVWATPTAHPVTVVPELDLGTTGKLGVGPWQKDETYRDPATTTVRP